MDINSVLTDLAVFGLGVLLAHLKSYKTIKGLKADRNNLAAALAYREGELLPRIHPKEQEEIDVVIDALMLEHSIDRVATLWACNGASHPTETTSISVKNKMGHHEEYYRVSLDSHYVSYLLSAEANGHHVISFKDLPSGSVLHGIYQDAGINHSVLVPLYYEINSKYGIRGWLYMSCARCTDKPFTSTEIRAIQSACALKGAIYEKAKLSA